MFAAHHAGRRFWSWVPSFGDTRVGESGSLEAASRYADVSRVLGVSMFHRVSNRALVTPARAHTSRVVGPVAVAALVAATLTLGCGSTDNPNGAVTPGAGAGVGENCGTGGNFDIECTPVIDLFDKTTNISAPPTYAIDTGDLGPTGSKTWQIAVRNTGTGALVISKVELIYSAQSPAEGAKPAFTCTNDAGTPCAQSKWAAVQPIKTGGIALINVGFSRQEDTLKRDAILRITSNATKTVVQIRFSTAAGAARISVKPDFMDFGFVQVDSEKIQEAKVFNIGNTKLSVTSMDLSSLDADLFTFIVDGKEYKAGQKVVFEPTLAVLSNASFSIKGIYRGKDDLPHNGTILLATNDGTANDGAPGQKAVNVKVNSTGPCLLAKPQNVVFGGTAVGSKGLRPLVLESCGDLPVEISDIAFAAPGAGEFGIDWSTLTGGGEKPTAQKPLKIAINQSVTVQLTYEPEGVNPVKDGLPVFDTARLVIASNIGKKTTEVTLEGVAASADCPTGIITVQEGDTVVPQTTLHLDGLQSFVPGAGGVSKYAWEVSQPKGSVGLYQPNSVSPQVTFQPNVAGDYIFRLRVWDAAGKESCFPAVKTVKVLPDEAIHVELLWDTPADKDQSDEGPAAGADLDLHFAHSYASVLDFDGDGANDPWFDAKYDCFWFNKSPEWGSYDPNVDDNPSLDRDDTDGAGPENLNLTLPEDGKEYAVGVHYFNDNGWGPSIAEVRIYIYGQLQFQVTSKPINTADLWYVADIQWPSGNIASKLDKQSKPFFVTPKYPAPEL